MQHERANTGKHSSERTAAELISAMNRTSSERIEKSSSRLNEYRQYMDK